MPLQEEITWFPKGTLWKEFCKHAYFIKAQVHFQGNYNAP